MVPKYFTAKSLDYQQHNGGVRLADIKNMEGIQPRLRQALEASASMEPAATQANSTATDVAGLVTDFNALLAKLKAAGLMK